MPEMLIGGEWRAGSAHQEIEVVNPATEETVASVPAGSADDVALAVATAKRAFADWSRTDAEQRAGILAKAADLIHDNAKSLAQTLTADQGKPIAEPDVADQNGGRRQPHLFADRRRDPVDLEDRRHQRPASSASGTGS